MVLCVRDLGGVSQCHDTRSSVHVGNVAVCTIVNVGLTTGRVGCVGARGVCRSYAEMAVHLTVCLMICTCVFCRMVAFGNLFSFTLIGVAR